MGADLAFEYGASAGDGEVEVYLPWASYNEDMAVVEPTLTEPSEDAYEVAARFHPGWAFLKHGARKLHARNAHIILGKDLDDPVDVVVCWTPDGSKDGKGKKTGGTGQALRIAADWKIEVHNLKNFEDWAPISLEVDEALKLKQADANM